MSTRHQPGDVVRVRDYAGFRVHGGLARITGDGWKPSLCCGCGDDHCREWATLCGVGDDEGRMWCHVADCEMEEAL